MGKPLLRILACASAVLLLYEAWTLIGSVLRPLLANPHVLQTDFHYYYDAAVRFSGDRSQLYRATDDVIAGFAYPPPAIVPFLWLARWPLGTALLAFTILSYLMMAVAAQQWLKYLRAGGAAVDRPSAIMLLLVVFALGPTYMNAVFGQVNAFVLASAVAFVRLAPAAAIEAGFVLALGAWLKIYPALMAVTAIWDRSTWKAIGYALLSGLAIAIVLLPIVPWQSYRDFVTIVLGARADKTAIHIANQSLVAFLERFRFPSEMFINWTGREAVTVSTVSSVVNWLFALVTVAVLSIRRAPAAMKAASLMALIAVIAPLGWGHTYVMVLPLVLWQLARLPHASPAAAAIMAAAVAALMIPATRHLPIDFAPDWLENIMYSRYLLATVALMCLTPGAHGRSKGSTEVGMTDPPDHSRA